MPRGMNLSHRPTWMDPYRFIFAPDIHWGYEVVNGKKRPMHNAKAVQAMLAFTHDFRPHGFIFGGDQLDLGAISHHNDRKRASVENLRIQQDLDEFSLHVMAPIEDMEIEDRFFMIGNHEEWLNMLTDAQSGLRDTLTFERLLNLSPRGWKEVPQGGHIDFGKLRFVHGDQLSGGDAVAKAAIMEHNKSIAFGHFHTHQQYVKHSPVDSAHIHIGIAVPSLANRGPAYGKKRANKWATGFMYGVVWPDGTFNHYVPIMTDNRFYANGKVFKGR